MRLTPSAAPPVFCQSRARRRRGESGSPGKMTLGIRPEHVRVCAEGDNRDTAQLVEPLGKDTLLYSDPDSERPMVAIVEGLQLANFRVGQPVGLTFTDANIFLFYGDGRRVAGA